MERDGNMKQRQSLVERWEQVTGKLSADKFTRFAHIFGHILRQRPFYAGEILKRSFISPPG